MRRAWAVEPACSTTVCGATTWRGSDNVFPKGLAGPARSTPGKPNIQQAREDRFVKRSRTWYCSGALWVVLPSPRERLDVWQRLTVGAPSLPTVEETGPAAGVEVVASAIGTTLVTEAERLAAAVVDLEQPARAASPASRNSDETCRQSSRHLAPDGPAPLR